MLFQSFVDTCSSGWWGVRGEREGKTGGAVVTCTFETEYLEVT